MWGPDVVRVPSSGSARWHDEPDFSPVFQIARSHVHETVAGVIATDGAGLTFMDTKNMPQPILLQDEEIFKAVLAQRRILIRFGGGLVVPGGQEGGGNNHHQDQPAPAAEKH